MVHYDHNEDKIIIGGKNLEILGEFGCLFHAFFKNTPPRFRDDIHKIMRHTLDDALENVKAAGEGATDEDIINAYINNILKPKGE